MTIPPGLRALPVRVRVADAESLHSWIEALAGRYRMTVREILPAIGLPAPRTPYGLIRGISADALRSLEEQAGIPGGRLDDAVLDRYAGLGLAGARGRPAADGRMSLWARASGSGFCPRCLADNGGRWPLAWHLNWTFACTRHHAVIAVECPACGRRPWSGENRLDHIVDPRRCCHALSQGGPAHAGPHPPRCGARLAEQETRELGDGHPLIECQRWINGILASPAEVAVAGMNVPPETALEAVGALMRYAVIADGGPGGERAARLLPGPPSAEAARARQAGSAAGKLGPLSADPGLFGAAAAMAADVLTAPTLAAAARAASWMLGPARRDSLDRTPWPSRLDAGATGSPVLDAIALRRRAATMTAAERLTFRTESRVPRRPPGRRMAGWPFRDGQPTSVPARLVPQSIWPIVARTLTRDADQDTGMLAVTISMAVVRCGTAGEWGSIAASLGLPTPAAGTVTSVLRRLGAQGRLEGLLASVDALAEELTLRPPPIDYARRRHVFRDVAPTAAARLRRACHDAGMVLTTRRRRYATMLVWETLTGSDVRFHSGALAPRDHPDRARYAAFRDSEGEGIAGYVAIEAERLLLRHRINEPVAWRPEPAGDGATAWRSPPADMTRRLPGWESPSRQGTLRRGARDHTSAARLSQSA